MKATLTFSLPDEEEQFNDAVKASEYKALVCDIEDYIESLLNDDELDDDAISAYEDVLSRIRNYADQFGLELY